MQYAGKHCDVCVVHVCFRWYVAVYGAGSGDVVELRRGSGEAWRGGADLSVCAESAGQHRIVITASSSYTSGSLHVYTQQGQSPHTHHNTTLYAIQYSHHTCKLL